MRYKFMKVKIVYFNLNVFCVLFELVGFGLYIKGYFVWILVIF